jgi:hypothetical protein
METQTRYDLNAALENWRAELTAQPNLMPEVRRELETHLRDAIAGFQQRGLNDEESFWLACKRVGQPPQLGDEFVKADPAKVWRDRIFWMAVGIIVFWQLTTITTNVVTIMLYYLSTAIYGFYIKGGFWFTDAAVFFVGIILAKGFSLKTSRLANFFNSRFRLAVLAAVLTVITALTQMEVIREVSLKEGDYPSVVSWGTWFQTFGHMLLGYFKFSLAPLIFLILFFPKLNRKTPKRA